MNADWYRDPLFFKETEAPIELLMIILHHNFNKELITLTIIYPAVFITED
jgi:hypothetical protein